MTSNEETRQHQSNLNKMQLTYLGLVFLCFFSFICTGTAQVRKKEVK